MPAPKEIKELVEKFDENKKEYLSASYNEEQLRSDFLDPFFMCLGWDIKNKKGISQLYREVLLESSLKKDGKVHAPDYSFRIGRVRKFFLEAKKPSVNLTHDYKPAFQVRRYGWSAKLLVSILSDFEE